MQYLIELKDERKKDFLLELLANLDFVQVKPTQNEEVFTPKKSEKEEGQVDDEASKDEEFFSAAGMLSHWTISAEELKKKAWGLDKK